MQDFPAIRFMVHNARWLAVAAAISLMAGCCYVGWRSTHIEFAALGVLVVAPVYVIAKSYLELLALVSDMLLPK